MAFSFVLLIRLGTGTNLLIMHQILARHASQTGVQDRDDIHCTLVAHFLVTLMGPLLLLAMCAKRLSRAATPRRRRAFAAATWMPDQQLTRCLTPHLDRTESNW